VVQKGLLPGLRRSLNLHGQKFRLRLVHRLQVLDHDVIFKKCGIPESLTFAPSVICPENFWVLFNSGAEFIPNAIQEGSNIFQVFAFWHDFVTHREWVGGLRLVSY
jgi:hypothetical protein